MGKDFLNGDYSFKNWFKIMWKNWYIQLFILSIAIIIAGFVQKDFFYDQNGYLILVTIGTTMAFVISYLGFFKFWKDLKNGKSS